MPRKSTPKLCTHRATGTAYVTLAGKRVYLGRADAPDVQERYDRTVAEWLAAGRASPTQAGITVVEILEKYLAYARGYYRDADGKTARSINRVEVVVKTLRPVYGSLLAEKFGPLALRAMRERWIGEGDDVLSRKTVNDYVQTVKQIFRWAASHELVPVAIYQALATVENLKQGRSRAKDSERVLPVFEKHIQVIKEHVSSPVWALIQLQLLTGARSGELLRLRPCDINMADPECWLVTLQRHKTAHHGKTRTLYIGPAGQDIIRPFLDRAVDAFLFSPQEGNAERKALTRKTEEGGRRENQKPSRTMTTRKMGDCYTKDSYARAIRRGCVKAGIIPWHPHQLRHNAATALRKVYGVEAAGVILGHSRTNVTELYAEKNQAQAREIMKQIG